VVHLVAGLNHADCRVLNIGQRLPSLLATSFGIPAWWWGLTVGWRCGTQMRRKWLSVFFKSGFFLAQAELR